jgi:acetyl esterase/lipase
MRGLVGLIGGLVLGLCGRTGGAVSAATVEYGRADDKPLLMDVRVPEGKGTFPIVLYVHGGGWSSGDRSEVALFATNLLQAGMLCCSVEYRLAPTNGWPACYEDVVAAVRWLKAHGKEYGGDPERFALLGYSAGGHLACYTAVMADKDLRFSAVVGFAPPTDLVSDTERRGGLSQALQNVLHQPKEVDEKTRKVLFELSPLNHVRSGLPPFLLVHGTEDKSVPYDQSIQFQARLKESGVACDLLTISNAPHRISDWPKYDSRFKEETVGWLAQRLGVPAAGKKSSSFNP